LFSDSERKQVGTAYKQVNREAAMYIGLEFAGKKLVELAKQGEKQAGKNKTLLLHCWRGGMRSSSMAWLFETMGIECLILEGGYKQYRKFVREEFERERELVVIGGRTGSGKTQILHRLAGDREQVIDLEGLARHKGSAFGAIGELPQPTTEQFENDLCSALLKLDRGKRTWIEDESRNVGRCVLPGELYARMKAGRILFLDIPRESRARHLVSLYADVDNLALEAAIEKISRKLGGDRARQAMEAIREKDYLTAAMITLQYYDKAYMFSLRKNHGSWEDIPSPVVDHARNAQLLIEHLDEEKV